MLLRRPTAILSLLLPVLLGACSWIGGRTDDTFDYRTAPRPTRLDAPPDLSQLPRDERFTVPSSAAAGAAATEGGPSSSARGAAATEGGPSSSARGAAATEGGLSSSSPSGSRDRLAPSVVAVPAAGSVVPSNAVARLVRSPQGRWLEADVAPEVVYARLKNLWERLGWKIAVDDPAAGILETEWKGSRPPVQEDGIRSSIRRIIGKLDSPGEQSRLRARIERKGASLCEVTITQRLIVEEPANSQSDHTIWSPRTPDAELEAEMLQRLANDLGPVPVAAVAVATTAVATVATTPAPAVAPIPAAASAVASAAPAAGEGAAPAAAATAATAAVHKVAIGGFDTIQLEEPFDRAWRRVASALDRAGFTVEEREREKGLFYIRYLDPDYEAAEREKKGWWDRMFHSDAKVPEQKFRIHVSTTNHLSSIEVLDAIGNHDAEVSARHIVDLLIEQLR